MSTRRVRNVRVEDYYDDDGVGSEDSYDYDAESDRSGGRWGRSQPEEGGQRKQPPPQGGPRAGGAPGVSRSQEASRLPRSPGGAGKSLASPPSATSHRRPPQPPPAAVASPPFPQARGTKSSQSGRAAARHPPAGAAGAADIDSATALATAARDTHPSKTDFSVLKNVSRTSLSIVVVGHVDAGKSTLMGHLLVKTKAVKSSLMQQYARESQKMNKESFQYAWVFDEGADERERGVTIDVCLKSFATDTKWVNILDAPGHADFIGNVILGSAMADAAVLVVDAADFATGFGGGGTTHEHLQIVRALGIPQLLVVVNKMDLVQWSEIAFERIKTHLLQYITGSEIRFPASAVRFVPTSGYFGVNIVPNDEPPPELKWWTEDFGHSVLSAIDTFQPGVKPEDAQQLFKQCCRAIVTDVWLGGDNVYASAKVISGVLHVGDNVAFFPSCVSGCTIKSLVWRGGEKTSQVPARDFAEQIVIAVTVGEAVEVVTASSILYCRAGSLGGDAPPPDVSGVHVMRDIFVRIVGLSRRGPRKGRGSETSGTAGDGSPVLTEGIAISVHVHAGTHAGYVAGLALESNPKSRCALLPGKAAIARLALESPVVLLGPSGERVILRLGGSTAAAGITVTREAAVAALGGQAKAPKRLFDQAIAF